MRTAILCLSALTLIFSPRCMAAAQGAASAFASGVMPALLPMLILGRLAPVGGSTAGVIAFGFLSGSPAATRRVHQSCPGAQWLYCACGVMSPMFFAGTLAGQTGQRAQAWAALLCHWLSALLAGLIWRMIHGPGDESRSAEPSSAPSLPGAIQDSAQALLGVCGAMMLFSVAFALLEGVLCTLFPGWTARNGRLLSILHSLVEIGGGAFQVLDAWPHPPWPLLCALCSFGGLSIQLQCLLFTGKSLRPAKLMQMRMLHGALAYGLCQGLFRLLPFS